MRAFSDAFSIDWFGTLTYPRTSKKHGKGQPDGGGQFPHREIIAKNVGDGDSTIPTVIDFPEVFLPHMEVTFLS